MPEHRWPRTPGTVGLAALMAALLAGCASSSEGSPTGPTAWAPSAAHPNQVVSQRSEMRLRPMRGVDVPLPAHEAARLGAFLDGARPSPAARITLVEEALPGSAAAVAAHLRERGVPAAAILIEHGATRGEPSVLVRIDDYAVVPPQCGRWPEMEREAAPANFGCATSRALGLMVADPLDLVAGQELGQGDAAPQVGAVERYRAGQIPPLKAEEGLSR